MSSVREFDVRVQSVAYKVAKGPSVTYRVTSNEDRVRVVGPKDTWDVPWSHVTGRVESMLMPEALMRRLEEEAPGHD